MKQTIDVRHQGGDTGRIFEVRFMGEAKVSPEFFVELERLPRTRGHRFPKRMDVFRLYEKYYHGDPTNPEGTHARELRLAVADALGLSSDADLERLRFYSTLKTPMDVLFGVDGFITYKESDGAPERFVTLDATLRKQKVEEGGKADVIIGELPDAVQEEKAYLDTIERYGHQIAEKLTSLDRRVAA